MHTPRTKIRRVNRDRPKGKSAMLSVVAVNVIDAQINRVADDFKQQQQHQQQGALVMHIRSPTDFWAKINNRCIYRLLKYDAHYNTER